MLRLSSAHQNFQLEESDEPPSLTGLAIGGLNHVPTLIVCVSVCVCFVRVGYSVQETSVLCNAPSPRIFDFQNVFYLTGMIVLASYVCFSI